MEDASERAVVVDLPDAWMRRVALEPQREVDPAILRRETDRARAHLADDPATFADRRSPDRVDGCGRAVTDTGQGSLPAYREGAPPRSSAGRNETCSL